MFKQQKRFKNSTVFFDHIDDGVANWVGYCNRLYLSKLNFTHLKRDKILKENVHMWISVHGISYKDDGYLK